MRHKGEALLLLFLTGAMLFLSGCNSLPIASFTVIPSIGVAPLTVSFDASSSSDSDGSIAAYEWNFGDGSHGEGVTTTHRYTSPGSYTAKLTVRDNEGGTANAEATVTVAKVITYNDLFRHNESYIGDVIYFQGQIIQVRNELFGGYVWRVATERSEYLGYTGDVLWVNYEGPRFLEGDIIDLYGTVKGLRTYTAIFGQQVAQ